MDMNSRQGSLRIGEDNDKPSLIHSGLGPDPSVKIVGMMRYLDSIIIVASGVLAFGLANRSYDLPFYYQESILVALLLSINALQLARVYHLVLTTRMRIQMLRIVFAWTMVMAVLMIAAQFLDIYGWFRREWLIAWFLLAIGGFILTRTAIKLYRHHLIVQGLLVTHIALVGAGELGGSVIRQLRKSLHHLKIIGVFDDQIRAKGEVEECPYRGSVDDLLQVARSERIDEIILAVNEATPAEINSLLAKLSQLPINTKICAFNLNLELPVRGYTALAGLPLLHVFERPLSGWGSTIKAVEDKILGGLILILVAPLLLLIGLLVKLDSPGPVLFRQKRYGFNNNEITVYKFRTMYQNGETNPTVPQAKRNDPRVTRLGWFLRKSSLDELPQLINVLQGEMSLVGPRPHAVEHNQHYGQIMDGYLGRHRVKPGITGWAQVNGLRGETNTLEMMRLRVQYDLYYIDHWSIYFDVKILVLTVLFGFIHKNAY